MMSRTSNSSSSSPHRATTSPPTALPEAAGDASSPSQPNGNITPPASLVRNSTQEQTLASPRRSGRATQPPSRFRTQPDKDVPQDLAARSNRRQPRSQGNDVVQSSTSKSAQPQPCPSADECPNHLRRSPQGVGSSSDAPTQHSDDTPPSPQSLTPSQERVIMIADILISPSPWDPNQQPSQSQNSASSSPPTEVTVRHSTSAHKVPLADALVELLGESDAIFQERISSFTTYPHPTAPTFSRDVILQFTNCMELLLKVLAKPRQSRLTNDEEWRIRMLIFSLPRLLLRTRPTASVYERNRKALAACKAFVNGNLFSRRGSPGLFKEFQRDMEAPRRRGRTKASTSQQTNAGNTSTSEQATSTLVPSYDLLQRVQGLVRAGSYGSGVRMLTSPGISKQSPAEIHRMLLDLHPTHDLPAIDSDTRDPFSDDDVDKLLDEWDARAIRKAINRSSNRSAPDQFGWRARELLGRIFTLKEDVSVPWLEHLVLPFVQNTAPTWAAALLGGGLLIPLGKGDKPGIRPIGIGDLIRKIIARLFIHSNREIIGKFFTDGFENYSQLGVSVPGGAEKLVNLVSITRDLSLSRSTSERTHQSHDSPSEHDFVIAACDNKNGFNNASRSLMFDCLAGKASRDYSDVIKVGDNLPCPTGFKHFKAFISFVTCLYAPASLYNYIGEDGVAYPVHSTAGFHQGCALSSFLFSLTVFPIVGKLLRGNRESLGASFLDNHFVLGPLNKVLPTIAALDSASSDTGMWLNPVDSFLHIPSWRGKDPSTYEHILQRMRVQYPGVLSDKEDNGNKTPGFEINNEGIKALGVPVGTDAFIQPILDKRVNTVKDKLQRLVHIPDGRIWASLLRTCYALMPAYHLRIIPTATLTRTGYLDAIQQLFSDHIAHYLAWPQDWNTQEDPRDANTKENNPERYIPSFRYRNAIRQLQNPLPHGGFGLGSVHTISISAFFAAACTSLLFLYDDRRKFRSHPLLSSLPQCANKTLTDFISQSPFLCGWNDSREVLLRLRYPPDESRRDDKPCYVLADTDVKPNESAQTIILPSLAHCLWMGPTSARGPDSLLKKGEPPPAQRSLTRALCTFPYIVDPRPITDAQRQRLRYEGKTEITSPNPHHHMRAAGPPEATHNWSYKLNVNRIRHESSRPVPLQAAFEDREQTVFPHDPAPPKGQSSGSKTHTAKRVKHAIHSFPLSFLGAVPTHSQRDAFPRDFFITFLNFFLGLPQPCLTTHGGELSRGSPGTTCLCGDKFDNKGLHALTCKRWYQQTATVGHAQILQSIDELLGNYGVPITIQESQLPRHDGTIGTMGKRGDIFIEREYHSSSGLHFQRGVVADLSLTCDFPGKGTYAGYWPCWLPHRDSDNVRNRFRAKYCKHSPPYTTKGFFFVPLIASTVGQLHPDFLRFLWHYSRVPSDHPLLYELYTTGEVRFGYSQGDDLLRTIQKALFFRLKARITSLVARTTAARILGYSCLVEKKVRFRPFPSQHHEYNPYFLLAPPSHITSIEAHTSAPVQTGVDVAVA